jgi:transglutaminase/protease-like cytokinesis protein 3
MAELDEYARACPPEYTRSVQDLAAYLTDPFPEPLHKIRAIFAWVTDNISYDVHSFLNHIRKSQQPQDVLQSRSSVCEGYARLTQALGEACHLPIRMISGYAKGAFLKPQRGLRVDDRGGHAWNCILLHGQYLMIDSTWGAGHLSTDGNPCFNKAFNPFFFLTDPTKFIYSHFPRDINEQYLNPPFSESEFFDLPWTKETYHRHNLLLLSPKPRTSVMETNDDTLDIFIEAQSNGAVSEVDGISGHLKDKDGHVQPAIGQRAVGYKEEGRDVWWIHVVCSQSGEFELNLFVYKNLADSNVSAEPLFYFYLSALLMAMKIR